MSFKYHAIIMACGALLLAAAGRCSAQEVPPGSDCMNLPASVGPDEREACQLHAQVRHALEREQWLEVELLLERILMYQPNDAEAMLQLAMVLAARDRPASAKALIAALRDDERTSQGHRLRLQAMLDNEDASASAQTVNAAARNGGAATQLVWSLGRSSNPMARSSADQIILTLPGGDISLPLEERPQSATILNALFYHRWANGLEMLLSTQNANADGARMGARLALAGPLGQANQLHWSLSSQQSLDGSRRDTASLLWPGTSGTATLYSLGAFSENRSRRHGLLLRAQTSLGQWQWQPRQQGQGVRLQLDGWLEYEHSLNHSPSALRAGAQSQWSWARGWQIQSYLYAQQDLNGYSPLLNNGQAREMLTGYLALEKQWPQLWLGGHVGASLYLSRRWSNLALFGWEDRGINLSWKRSW